MKRKRPNANRHHTDKRQKTENVNTNRPVYPLLRAYYPEVVTLRQYLASRLSKTSKRRRKNVLQYGNSNDAPADAAVVQLLDTTLVGAFKHIEIDDSSFVEEDITIFTQQLAQSDSTITLTPGEFRQNEIVDFAIWLLFRRQQGNTRPKHLLCQNFQRWLSESSNDATPEINPGIPNVYSCGTNPNVQTLRTHPWNVLPGLLGRHAQRILVDLLIECGIFVPIGDSSNLSQVSGVPMCDLDATPNALDTPGQNRQQQDQGEWRDAPGSLIRGLSDIRFVRHRMLYARPAYNKTGAVKFGINQIHVLNRCRNVEDLAETHHVMKYMFPAQFGLHNVLKSEVDDNSTAQPFKDYTLREKEINRHHRKQRRQELFPHGTRLSSLPKRLRGGAAELVKRLRKRHLNCAYATLLDHYCPRPNGKDSEGSISQASTAAQVSAFCRAAAAKVFPKDLWRGNKRVIDHNIDRFIRLRRYESMSLHDVLQGLPYGEIDWLIPPGTKPASKLSKSDFEKRKELLAELLYYLFDSFLIPLIRGHFHVTESNIQRNQLFYFRHDVWKELSEPAILSLKHNMLEECTTAKLKQMMTKRSLGVSHVRLLPKEQGMRPIINLRRRVQKIRFGQMVLGKSINSLLNPVFSVLNLEKARQPDILGSALFSVDDIFPRLQSYRQSLRQAGLLGRPLYFAKVDVKACFDTIPQKRLLQLVEKVINANQYQIARYSRAKLAGGHDKETPGFGAKPSWKFLTKAAQGHQTFDFHEEVQADTAEGRTRSVYINGIAQRRESRRALLAILEEHVESNLIRIGRRFYRQKEGIPQGSIVSSLLCSYFYAELEREILRFVDDGKSVLLRLIDDFLVISTERSIAAKFLKTMHAGVPDFGVEIKMEKSRANFDVEVNGQTIPNISDSSTFPYCGNAIDTRTLDISKDQERRLKSNIADSVTVEFSKLPGQSFYRKTLNALKLQMHAMLLSTSYNSLETVLSNLKHSFTEVAQKSYHYIKSLPPAKQPGDRLVIRVVEDAIALAFVLMKKRKKSRRDVIEYECCVTREQTRWLVCSAFADVYRRRQTKHRFLLKHLEQQLQVGKRVRR